MKTLKEIFGKQYKKLDSAFNAPCAPYIVKFQSGKTFDEYYIKNLRNFTYNLTVALGFDITRVGTCLIAAVLYDKFLTGNSSVQCIRYFCDKQSTDSKAVLAVMVNLYSDFSAVVNKNVQILTGNKLDDKYINFVELIDTIGDYFLTIKDKFNKSINRTPKGYYKPILEEGK